MLFDIPFKDHVFNLKVNPGTDTRLSLPSSMAGENYGMRLIHFFTISTCEAISDSPAEVHLWREVVPQLALSYDFLLCGLLSITSLHLALLNPSNDHTAAAIWYHSKALELFRPHLEAITPSNVSAIFCFSCLIPLYAFGIHNAAQSPLNPIDELLQVFTLLRGISIIVREGMYWLERGHFPSLRLPEPSSDPRTTLSTEVQSALAELSQYNLSHTANDKMKEIFVRCISMLRNTFMLVYENPSAKKTVLPFPIMVPQEFMQSLRDREPMALAILANYAVVLHWFGKHIWLREWGRQTMMAVKGVLAGRKCEGCIKWAVAEVQDLNGWPVSHLP